MDYPDAGNVAVILALEVARFLASKRVRKDTIATALDKVVANLNAVSSTQLQIITVQEKILAIIHRGQDEFRSTAQETQQRTNRES